MYICFTNAIGHMFLQQKHSLANSTRFCNYREGEQEKKKKIGIPVSYPVTYALSPCCTRSRPTSSSFGVTLMPPGHTRSIILIMTAVIPIAHASAANAPTAFSYN